MNRPRPDPTGPAPNPHARRTHTARDREAFPVLRDARGRFVNGTAPGPGPRRNAGMSRHLLRSMLVSAPEATKKMTLDLVNRAVAAKLIGINAGERIRGAVRRNELVLNLEMVLPRQDQAKGRQRERPTS